MKLKIRVIGPLVHDIGYRAFLLEMAEDLDLIGFSARNMLEDDEQLVLGLAEGDLDTMDQFRRIVEIEHPPKAEVREIIIAEYRGTVGGIDAFGRKFSARQLRKGISSIIRIETMQGQMLHKQDQMLLMQGEMLKKQCEMLEKQDMTRESIEKTGHDIVDELKATKQYLAGEIPETKQYLAGVVRGSAQSIVCKIHRAKQDLAEEIRESAHSIVEDVKETRDVISEQKLSMEERLDRVGGDIDQIKTKIGL
ncbi:MAG: acylphosphatase [Methanotrichaceae archaeon]|nr:acylphosphatase [Methanotrichaceae archaeon]